MKRAGWLSRSTPLKSKSSLSRRSRIAPVGRRKVKLKRKQFGEQAEACRKAPCCVCGAPGPSDPHHVVPRSRGGLDEHTVPLCHAHHMEGHTEGWATFEARYNVDLEAIAREIG